MIEVLFRLTYVFYFSLMYKLRGHTLMEIIVAVALIGLIASFAVPSFTKSIQKNLERDNYFKLLLIAKKYQIDSKKGVAHSSSLASIAAINTDFELSLYGTENFTYGCQFSPAFVCTATSPDGWALHVHGSGYVPHCGVDPCPSCADELSGGCPY